MSHYDDLLYNDKKLLFQEMCKLRNFSVPNDFSEIFHNACYKLKICLKIYYAEDTSNCYLYLCQIILNGKYLIKGSGPTKNEAFDNALYINFKQLDNQNLFTEEIKQNIDDIDLVEIFEETSKKYFSRYGLSKINNINYEKLKIHLKDNNIILSEEYYVNKNLKCTCWILLNKHIFLQYGSGIDSKDALANTITNLFSSYSLVSEKVIKNHFNVSMFYEELNNYLKEEKDIQFYYPVIEKFVKSKNWNMNINFYNGISTLKVNGTEVVRAEHSDKYCSYILLCKNLLRKLNTVQQNGVSNMEKMRHFSSTSSISSRISDNRGGIHLTLEEMPIKFKEIASKAEKERKSNENRPYWSILNNLFISENLTLVPQFSSDKGEYICTLNCKHQEITKASGDKKISSREAAAKEFVLFYLK